MSEAERGRGEGSWGVVDRGKGGKTGSCGVGGREVEMREDCMCLC